MTYPIGTILRRKTPYTEDEKVHLNRVQVAGEAPSNSAALGEWSGTSGEAVVVQPLDVFGPPESLPIDVGSAQYEVEYMPEPTPLITQTEQVTRPVERLRAESPEQRFARADREAAEMRARSIAEAPVVEAATEPEVAVEAAVPAKPAAKAAAKRAARK